MSPNERPSLLGRLVYELSWLTRQGEPTATRALAVMLEEPLLKASTLDWLGEKTGQDLSTVRKFEAERIHDDARRTDLEGLDSRERPVLIVEAKFGAAFGMGQLRDYFQDQTQRLEQSDGALVLLVPENRRAEAQRLLDVEAGTHSIGTAVVTWGEWFDSWDHAVAKEPAGVRSIAADLTQLRDMAASLGGFILEPLAQASFGAAWRDREGDLRDIVGQVTLALNDSSGWLPPITHSSGFDPARYVPVGNGGSWLAVGVASRFADEGTSPPIWVRFHKRTPGFSAIKKKILASDYHERARLDDGHVWLPLRVDPGLAGPDLVSDLVHQVRAIQLVAQVV